MDATKKEKIIEAAINIFSGNLFHQVTMEEVAAQAGVGKGTIYLYFESKEDLFRQTVRYATNLYFKKIQEGLHHLEDPREKLAKIVCLQLSFAQEDIKTIYFLVGESMVPPLTFQEEIKSNWLKFVFLIEEIIKEGIEKGCFRKMDTCLASRIFLGGMASLITSHIFNGEEVKNKKHLAKKVAEIFLNGIASAKQEGEPKN